MRMPKKVCVCGTRLHVCCVAVRVLPPMPVTPVMPGTVAPPPAQGISNQQTAF